MTEKEFFNKINAYFKGVLVVNEKKYNIWIKLIAVLMAVVLTGGIVLSIRKPDINTVKNDDNEIIENKNFQSMIDTRKPESYSSLLGVLSALRSEYSDSVKLFTLGYSTTGKAIPMVTIGSGEKKALIIGGIHAREHLTTKYLLRCIEDYCYALENGEGAFGEYDLKKLFSQYTLYIVPCANPDGLEIVLSKMKASSKVTIDKLEDYKANYNGVDLNRNFPLAWDEIDNGITKPFGYFFKGYKSASEKETQALMKLCEENNFSFLISVHVKGNCIFWGDLHNESYNGLYKAFASDIADVTGLYIAEPTEKATSYGGGFENWFRHTYTKPGVCVELVENENIIKACGNENYADFHRIVNYDKTRYVIGAALASDNK